VVKDGKTLLCQKSINTGKEEILTVIEQIIGFSSPLHPDGIHVIMGPMHGMHVPVYIYNLATGETRRLELTEPAHRIE
ncbi:hypothetical protein, partial [Salmonella sp. SAL4355]|uniref:hypothetical protein n=1 Tax=Salmonella sp. SAL4355 TaxID=3159876 RepID=UPI00397AF10F